MEIDEAVDAIVDANESCALEVARGGPSSDIEIGELLGISRIHVWRNLETGQAKLLQSGKLEKPDDRDTGFEPEPFDDR